MPYYIFNFKKGDLSLEFESTDHRFVSYQMDKWIEEVAGITFLEPSEKQSVSTTELKPEEPAIMVKEEDIEVAVDNPVNTDIPSTITIAETIEEFEEPEEQVIIEDVEVNISIPTATTIIPAVSESEKSEPVAEVEEEVITDVSIPSVATITEVTKESEKLEPVAEVVEEVAEEVITEDPTPTVATIIESVEKLEISEKPAKKFIKEEDIEVITEDSESNVATITESVEELEKQVESAIKATQNIIKDSKEIEQTLKEATFANFDQQIPVQEKEVITPEIKPNEQEIIIDEKKDEISALDINEKAQNNKFYKILQEKFASLPEMVQSNLAKKSTEQTEQNLTAESPTIEELIDLKNPETLLDYLVIAAYYLKEIDLLDRYSLKQINSKVIKFIQKPINHAIIQEAVENNFLEVVPDYTGMADVTEYMITSEGINYLINVM